MKEENMFYIQENGGLVSQVYEIKAKTWEEAKKISWEKLNVGDVLAECPEEAIGEYLRNYHYINEEKCINYAVLNNGVWVNTDSGEDFRKDVYYFSDDEEKYLDSNGNEYDFN